MQELGKVLDETKPDAILFFGADHVETFSVTCVPTFAIVAGNRAIAKFAGREHNLPIHREMAEDILNQLVVDHGFDMAYSEDAELGHAFSVPFEYVIGGRNIPVIPFFTNVYVPPLPTPRRCAALGKAIAEIVKGRKERVAIIASGGMSHFPGTTKYLHPEFDFDRWLLSQFETGHTDALLDMTGTQLDEVGNTEMLSWAIMFGAIGKTEGELIDYIPTWHHGLGMMRFLPQRARKPSSLQVAEQFGGFQVPEPGLPVLQAPAGGGVRPQQAAVRVAAQRGAARARHRELRGGGRRVRPARRAADGGRRADQRRQGRPGQRARRTARRRRRASAAGADVAPRHLLDDAQTRTAGDGGGGETLKRQLGIENWKECVLNPLDSDCHS